MRVDLGESQRFHRFLQGQEIYGFRAPYNAICVSNSQMPNMHQYPKMRRYTSYVNCSILPISLGNGARVPITNSEFSYNFTGFGESINRFDKVLQDQEVFPYSEKGRFGLFEGNRENALIQGYSIRVPQSTSTARLSSPSSVLLFRQNSQIPRGQSGYGSNTQDLGNISKFSSGERALYSGQSCCIRNEVNEQGVVQENGNGLRKKSLFNLHKHSLII